MVLEFFQLTIGVNIQLLCDRAVLGSYLKIFRYAGALVRRGGGGGGVWASAPFFGAALPSRTRTTT
jgi:hypothetical protein